LIQVLLKITNVKIFWDGWCLEGDDESVCVSSTARVVLDGDIIYIYTGEDYSDTVTSNAAGALYKIKLNT